MLFVNVREEDVYDVQKRSRTFRWVVVLVIVMVGLRTHPYIFSLVFWSPKLRHESGLTGAKFVSASSEDNGISPAL